jgi:hypothetical protein
MLNTSTILPKPTMPVGLRSTFVNPGGFFYGGTTVSNSTTVSNCAYVTIKCPKKFILRSYTMVLSSGAPNRHPKEWYITGSTFGVLIHTLFDYRNLTTTPVQSTVWKNPNGDVNDTIKMYSNEYTCSFKSTVAYEYYTIYIVNSFNRAQGTEITNLMFHGDFISPIVY